MAHEEYSKGGLFGAVADVQILFDNTLDVSAGARSVDLGAPGSGERFGFFLIQDGFDAYGHLSGALSFLAPGPARPPRSKAGSRS